MSPDHNGMPVKLPVYRLPSPRLPTWEEDPPVQPDEEPMQTYQEEPDSQEDRSDPPGVL